MADFEKSFALTNKHEGGYANNPNDRGGETYMGIARKFWPSWGGWKHIDTIKQAHGKTAKIINTYAGSSEIIQGLVKQFYLTNFWYPLGLSGINDQQLANNVYDFGVNAGAAAAAKRFQMAANAVCGGLVVDGDIGPKTIAGVNKLSGKAVFDQFNNLRRSYYENIIAHNPSQAQFRASWMSRIKDYNNA